MKSEAALSIYVLVQGWHGRRIYQHLQQNIPDDWTLDLWEFPKDLPSFIEEPKDLLSEFKPCRKYDLILSLGEHPVIPSLLPEMVRLTGAKAVITPIDNSEWIPPGVRGQVSRELECLKIPAVFPKPFCSLEADSGNRFIDEFAKRFGKPKLVIKSGNGKVKHAEVLRGSPCGSTQFVSRRLNGIEKGEAPSKASRLAQVYPCLASRIRDSEYGRPLIHVAAHIHEKAVLTGMS